MASGVDNKVALKEYPYEENGNIYYYSYIEVFDFNFFSSKLSNDRIQGDIMNILSGKIKWDIESGIIASNDSSFDNGKICLEANRINFSDTKLKSIKYSSLSGNIISMIGYISNINSIKSQYKLTSDNDLEIVEAIYNDMALSFINHLEGVFLISIYDSSKNIINIYQSFPESNFNLYYYENEDGLFFSTRLKTLLVDFGKKRSFNYNSAYQFLYNKHIIPNRNTFISGIYKLIPEEFLSIDLNSQEINILKIKTKRKSTSKRRAKNELISHIENSISDLMDQQNRTEKACALSSGYDSNIILHNLVKNGGEIDSFSIGGKNKSEVENASICAKQYSNVTFHSSSVPDNAIEDLPEIVWRTEGSIFEHGLFLQLSLARLIHDSRCSSIFLGECADQILDTCSIIKKIRVFKKDILHSSFVRRIRGNSFDSKNENYIVSGSYMLTKKYKKFLKKQNLFKDTDYSMVLHKSSSILNSFGIQGLYPFIQSDIMSDSKALGFLNYRKNYYKKKVAEVVNDNISKLLIKSGGATDIEFLFPDDIDFYNNLLERDFVKSLISENERMEIAEKPKNYLYLILQIMYLEKFNELFISGLHDGFFDSEELK